MEQMRPKLSAAERTRYERRRQQEQQYNAAAREESIARYAEARAQDVARIGEEAVRAIEQREWREGKPYGMTPEQMANHPSTRATSHAGWLD